MTQKTVFVSDLHLFTKRSVAGRFLEEMRGAAETADLFFLGGDIVDFKWSQFKNTNETIDAAHDWIVELIRDFDHCQFHYLLGNHDCHPKMVQRLGHIADEHSNFQWESYFVRLGNSIFLHGDVVDTGNHLQQQLEEKRRHWTHESPKGKLANLGYELMTASRIHRLAANFIHQPERVARRIMTYLNDIGHGIESGIQNVFFGHTHAQMTEFVFEGVSFNNGGAPIKGLPFNLIQTEINIDSELN